MVSDCTSEFVGVFRAVHGIKSTFYAGPSGKNTDDV
jgi:hypothetical protein